MADKLTHVGHRHFSAMMHGYLAFDAAGKLLVPFRTWRNTMTGPAAEELTEAFGFNIPQRWSIAHLYQAILNEEAHLSKTWPSLPRWRVCPLAADRPKGAGRGRRQRHVPHRQRHRRL